jgi:8-oxo-dGTP diphosphatase
LTCRKVGEKLEGYWKFPGGKIEDGETLQECLVRELREESGG